MFAGSIDNPSSTSVLASSSLTKSKANCDLSIISKTFNLFLSLKLIINSDASLYESLDLK